MKPHNKFAPRTHELALAACALLSLIALVVLAAPEAASLPQQQQQQQLPPTGLPAPSAQVQAQEQSASPTDGGQAAAVPGQQHQGSATFGVSASQQQPTRLPRINIYASKSEVKKLLGIDTRISYVTNGQLNTYPLGFTIPMGYHLSDMIFTWQNLGPTNVNYSISLVIGNIQAVERPLINITRSGLIPRHEQVFKITLPCSGKITDEVDVQVLINIAGLVPVAAEHEQQPGVDDLGAPAGPAVDSSSAAVQQQNELIAAAVSNASAQSADQMQADQQQQQVEQQQPPQAPLGQARKMRMVSHTLAIKRKKICTVHPVPVQPPAARQPELIRPPTQLPPNGATSSSSAISGPAMPPPPAPALPRRDEAISPAGGKAWPSAGDQQQQQDAKQTQTGHQSGLQQVAASTPVAEPAHQPAWTVGASSTQEPNAASLAPQPSGAFVTAAAAANQLLPRREQPVWPPRPPTGESGPPNPLMELLLTQRTASGGQAATGQAPPSGTNGNPTPPSSPLLFVLVLMSLVVLLVLIGLFALGSSSPGGYGRQTPLDKLKALTNCIWRRTSAGSRAVNKCTKHVGPITIKNGIIGTFGGGPSAHHYRHHGHHHAAGPAGGHQHAAAAGLANTMGRGAHTNSRAGMFHGPTKSTVSSLSGLSTISGPHAGQQQAGAKLQHVVQNANFSSLMSPYYFNKQQQQQPMGNYAPGYYGVGQHHYQQAPDNLLIGSSNHQTSTSPYHINMSNNQTTKLFLGGGGGGGNGGSSSTNNNQNQHSALEQGNYTIDNSYMPISSTQTGGLGPFPTPTARSDSGSVYQTIY